MAWPRRLCAALAVASYLGGLATALPWEQVPSADGLLTTKNDSNPFGDFPPVVKARQEDKIELRILPLGASIMSGVGSPEHSGFVYFPFRDFLVVNPPCRLRKWVRMALRNDGWPVNMVGTKQDGDDLQDNVRKIIVLPISQTPTRYFHLPISCRENLTLFASTYKLT